jgi:hypothetical protein
MSKPGLKIGISGKGRCNITNTASVREVIERFGPQGRFLWQALSQFSPADLRQFLDQLGIETAVERGGRVFPVGRRGPEVARMLANWVRDQGVRIQTSSRVLRLIASQQGVEAVEVANPNGSQTRLPCRAVILATGGLSYPQTGSSGDGWGLARELGHRLVPCRPALVPLKSKDERIAGLQGLGLKNIRASLWSGGKRQAQAFGELIFTHFGISGPVTLSLSLTAVDLLRAKDSPVWCIDLKPALDEARLDARLLRDIQSKGKRQLHNWLRGLLPARLIPVCLKDTDLRAEQQAGQLNARQRRRLRGWLKCFSFPITGHLGLEQAIVTAGGIELGEVRPQTTESRLTPGLYLAGEVLDLAADTGGFNLQAAFSTGHLAGKSAARQANGPRANE